MKGSEKQIKWAEDIINNAKETCESIKRMAAKYEANKDTAQKNADGSIELMETVNGRPALVRVHPITTAVAEQLAGMIEQGFAGMENASDVIDLRARFTRDALVKMALQASKH